MTAAERALYHQIHPGKFLVDWTAGVAAAMLLWQHRLRAGLLVGLVPPVVLSVPFLVGTFDRTLERYRSSPLGRYVARYMTRAMEGLRLLGLVGVWYGAWVHRPALIVGGVVLILGAWVRGWLWPGRGVPGSAA